jgi:hypothetical protein
VPAAGAGKRASKRIIVRPYRHRRHKHPKKKKKKYSLRHVLVVPKINEKRKTITQVPATKSHRIPTDNP